MGRGRGGARRRECVFVVCVSEREKRDKILTFSTRMGFS
jgi:hypothetical protein